jgi:TRAP-type uncharacterized transport system fused permease subunit
VLLAVLIAPALVELGFSPLASHMFILYLGMMSMITPPVAIGAFFAASLAGAEPMRTGFTAMRFGWTAYIVPFLFIFSPALLLQGNDMVAAMIAVATAIAGVWLVSIGITGYLFRPIPVALRFAFVVAGIGLLLPDQINAYAAGTDILGAIGGVILVGYEIMLRRRGTTAVGTTASPD